MAAIRSHFISLFSGGIFPDRKWWLSCFCLPHSKEEKPVRQPPLSENAIFTVQMNPDEEPKTEFERFSCLEGNSLHEEESQKSGAALSETPLANGFKVLLLDGLSFNNHLNKATSSLNEEHEVTAKDVDDLVDVASFNISQCSIIGADESLCTSPESSVSFDDAIKAFESEETVTGVQLRTANSDRDKAVSRISTCNTGFAGELSIASCPIPCSPVFADLGESQSLLERKNKSMNATREIRKSEVEIVNEVLSEGTDESKDRLKFSSDLINTSSSDLSFKFSSDLETSGIQADLTSFENTFVHLDICSENATVTHESNEDSEPCFRFATRPLSADANSGSLESTSQDLLSDSCHTEETPVVPKYENSQENRKSISGSCQSCGIVLSDSMEKPFINVSCLELCNRNSEQKTILLNDHTCCSATQATLFCNHFGQQSLQFEGEQAESDALFQSKFDDFVTEDSAFSDQLLKHEMQNKMDTSHLVAPGICLAAEQTYNQVAKTELETTFAEIAADRGNSAEIVDLSANCTGNAESTVNQLETCALTSKKEEASMPECLDGNYMTWNNRRVNEEEMDEFDSSMSLNSLLQIKLLFRSNSYETLENLVDGETRSLLDKALDEVFAVRRNREIFQSDYLNCEIKTEPGLLNFDERSSTEHHDPFNLSKSDVFQEIIVENFEQLFEEWLDDDFGFAPAINDESPPPPYSDRMIGQQHYSRGAFYLRDFEVEDDFLPPDLQSTVVQLRPETIFPLVDQATDIFWSRRRYGEPWSEVCPPETYFTVEGHYGNLDSCSQRSHETFLFHLVAEILQEIYSDELTEVPEPWQRVYNFKPKFVEAPPTTVDVLKPVIQNYVLQCLRIEKGFPHEMTRKDTGVRRQLDKKDMVDRLLITEMLQEEPSWTDYSKDANMIKNRVANKLFISLIDDTVQALKLIQGNALTNKCQ